MYLGGYISKLKSFVFNKSTSHALIPFCNTPNSRNLSNLNMFPNIRKFGRITATSNLERSEAKAIVNEDSFFQVHLHRIINNILKSSLKIFFFPNGRSKFKIIFNTK